MLPLKLFVFKPLYIVVFAGPIKKADALFDGALLPPELLALVLQLVAARLHLGGLPLAARRAFHARLHGRLHVADALPASANSYGVWE